MKIKAIYIKNLKMSEGKIAAQVAHAVKNVGPTPADISIIVLGVSTKKFKELTTLYDCYVQVDKGLTEVEVGTPTAAAWLEDELEDELINIEIKQDYIISDIEEEIDFSEVEVDNDCSACAMYANHNESYGHQVYRCCPSCSKELPKVS